MIGQPVVVVVGAGVAGLTAARSLVESGAGVIVVDKSRGVGGRMATRRIGDAVLDHGAQFVTARTDWFRAEIQAWEHAGVATPWFEGTLGADGITASDGPARHRGVPAMTGIAKHLATGLDVRLSTHVDRIHHADRRWVIEISDRFPIEADAIVLTAPAPQTLAMLDPASIDSSDRTRLEQIGYDPCIAVLAVLDGPSGIGHPAARRPAAGPVAWYADNAGKGISAVPALTVHATAAASRALWELDDATVVTDLLAGIDLAGAHVVDSHVHRWRFARTAELLPEAFLLLGGVPPAVAAGDGFGTSGRVEGAATSGHLAATAITGLLRG